MVQEKLGFFFIFHTIEVVDCLWNSVRVCTVLSISLHQHDVVSLHDRQDRHGNWKPYNERRRPSRCQSTWYTGGNPAVDEHSHPGEPRPKR